MLDRQIKRLKQDLKVEFGNKNSISETGSVFVKKEDTETMI